MNLTKTLLLAAALSTAASLGIAQTAATPNADNAAVQSADAKTPAQPEAKPKQATTSHKTKSHHAKKDGKTPKDATPAS